MTRRSGGFHTPRTPRGIFERMRQGREIGRYQPSDGQIISSL